MPKTSSKCLNVLLDDDGMKDRSVVARASIGDIDGLEVLKQRVNVDENAFEVGKTEARTTDDDIDAIKPSDSFELENKKERLRNWLNLTLNLRRLTTSEDDFDESVLDEEFSEGFVRIGDPYDYVCPEDIKFVEGKTDKLGRPVGKCVVTLHNGDDLFCSWKHGTREGFGNVTGPELEKNGIKLVQGYYYDGLLQGPGQVKLVNGCEFGCQFVDGLVDGYVVSSFNKSTGDLEKISAGTDFKTTGPFIGKYSLGKLTGPIWMSSLGGGWIHGIVDEDGDLSGDDIMFIYPDLTSVLYGSFSRGAMTRTRFTTVSDIDFSSILPVVKVNMPNISSPCYKYQPSNCRSVFVTPTQPEPYERSWVEVRESTVSGGGDGLFAKRDIPPETFISFYHGILYLPGQNADTECTDYMIYTDWNLAPHSHSIDIPEQFRSIKTYCASLAHKANHSFQPNSGFSRFYHPVFGLTCLGIKTLRHVSRGQEIFVNYKYSPSHAPVWFTDMIENI